MHGKLRRWWPVVKTLLSLAILALIAWRFAKDLSSLDLSSQSPDWFWLVPAALCYLGGLSLSALYWRRLMLLLDQPAPLSIAFRAYFVGQLGKYVPGKALALVMRASMMRPAGTSAGLAGLSAFYEVLVTMAAGALVALVLFLATDPAGLVRDRAEALFDVIRLQMPANGRIDRLTLILLSLGLCVAILLLISPAVLNRLVKGIAVRFGLDTPPALKTAWLGQGLAMTAPVWMLFGLALACALHSVPGAGLPWSLGSLAYLTAVMALAYVAGFIVPIAPGGLGVREFFLLELLSGELATHHGLDSDSARAKVALAVLVLRLAWTAAEGLVAGVFYLQRPAVSAGPSAQEKTPETRPPPEREQVA